MIIGIVAIAENFAIGRGGKLPWHYSSDLKFFKRTTEGNAIVMGRKTFDSIGKPLPKRLNIVLSRENTIPDSGIITVRDKSAVLELSNFLRGDIFIVGGASVYGEFSDVIEKWIVTEIPESIEDADAFMANDFLENYEIAEKTELEANLVVKTYLRRD